MDLGKIRDEVDKIDQNIAHLFEQRMKLCQDAAECKIETGTAVFDPERERQKLEQMEKLFASDLDRREMKEILSHMMAVSRKRQYQLLTEQGLEELVGFRMVKELPVEGKRVAYAGVEGAYGYEATMRFFGSQAEKFSVPNHGLVMKAVAEGDADYGVLPIENSSAGAVTDVYDLLMNYDICVVAEMGIPISHCLLGLPEAELSDIRRVHSHPQALQQCGEYLGAHPEWQQVPESNTAASAKMVAALGDRAAAAVASRTAGELYGLKVLASSINHNKSNMTRFVIVTKQKIYLETAKKLCLCLECRHETGALYHLLSHFSYNELNMTQIESRPIPGRRWEYRFFVDVEGNLKDSGVQNAIKGLKEETVLCRILGNC
ncbi:prephenate dehydratase [Hominifimenecus sp. rT4P-3]|uniref:prephenate dehydratase n=1 Tax=Hominifimenecus sp. rT4P-3 TaxID=3242979 RepID=UPI003DA20402